MQLVAEGESGFPAEVGAGGGYTSLGHNGGRSRAGIWIWRGRGIQACREMGGGGRVLWDSLPLPSLQGGGTRPREHPGAGTEEDERVGLLSMACNLCGHTWPKMQKAWGVAGRLCSYILEVFIIFFTRGLHFLILHWQSYRESTSHPGKQMILFPSLV